ncbi:uncharacterized protein LOC130053068 [Ostrea edulis]|uniref:uncharacterized protein LOC130053068 n=1 Tax=Ostrea edulis TaxID=37623 RepID=UPI0024AE9A20|nr:uncharacterized protein LOC130053068 [Ostrea edulis]
MYLLFVIGMFLLTSQLYIQFPFVVSISSVKCPSTYNFGSEDCNKKENITATYNVTTVAPKGDEKEQNRTQRNSSTDNTEQTESVNSTGLIIGICISSVVLITAIAVVLVLKRWSVAGCCSSRDDILDLTEQGPLNQIPTQDKTDGLIDHDRQ